MIRHRPSFPERVIHAADHRRPLLFLAWIPAGIIIYGVIASIGFALDYHAKMRERERKAARLEALLVESRLGALRMQLQPHFLFNALNTVAMLVRQGEAQTSVRVLARLSELIRQVLDDDAPQEVTLADELDFVARYLDIERLRFGDRLHVTVQADDDARSTPVPHLLLQPLVENAIRHGLARRTGATRLRPHPRRSVHPPRPRIPRLLRSLARPRLLRSGPWFGHRERGPRPGDPAGLAQPLDHRPHLRRPATPQSVPTPCPGTGHATRQVTRQGCGSMP